MKKIFFIGFSEVANYYTNLTQGFKDLNIEYYFFSYAKNIRNYKIEDSKFIDQKLLHLIVSLVNKNKFFKIFFFPLFFFYKIYLFIKYTIKCNTFIFSYNSSFLWLYDLPILKLFNKKIIYIYHGSDARPAYLSGKFISNGFSLDFIKETTLSIYKKNKIIEKYANYIIGYPAYCIFFSKKIVNYLWIGSPIDLSNYKKLKKKKIKSQNLRILHVSKEISEKNIFKQIILELKKKGYKISFISLKNVTNKKVLSEIQKSDILLDELYSDTPMAGLATEAAFFGVPAIVGGYYYQLIKKDLKKMKLPPSRFVHPNQVKQNIIELIKSKTLRNSLGKDAKEYLQTKWTPVKVVKRLLMVIEKNKLPKYAYFYPKNVEYFRGWAVNDEILKLFLKEYIDKFGNKGLFLSHNKKLKRNILEFIR